MREPCKDPGVDRNAEVAIAQTRRSLAECEDKRGLAVEDGDLVRQHFGVSAAAVAAVEGAER